MCTKSFHLQFYWDNLTPKKTLQPPFRMNVTSVFNYSGASSDTLNSLTGAANEAAGLTLADLSATNYSDSTNILTTPNSKNQAIFMNQPMSWWLSELNSGAVKYLPYSNHVNWAYTDASKVVYHIGRAISDALLPNRTSHMSINKDTQVATITYEPKHGLSRTDTRASMVPVRPPPA